MRSSYRVQRATRTLRVRATGRCETLSLHADLIVFWAPNLALPDRETLENEHRARMMLPEQVLGQALLYLVAAVGRQVVFRDPTRFAVVPGHESPEVEYVVARHHGYEVVEKKPGEPAKTAAELS